MIVVSYLKIVYFTLLGFNICDITISQAYCIHSTNSTWRAPHLQWICGYICININSFPVSSCYYYLSLIYIAIHLLI
jgi:hypothetical protein